MEPSSPLLYIKEEEPEDDESLYCEQCRSFYINKCEVHGATLFIPDNPVPVGVPDRARKTLPVGLEVLQSDIPDAGLGVFNKGGPLPVGAHFGPYQGELVDEEEAMTSGFSWVIYRNGQCEEYIDARRETHANWMRYVNCARNDEEQNLVAFQYQGEIFYRCSRPIEPGQELLMWYNDEYAKNLSVMFNNFWNKKSNTHAPEMSDTMLEVISCSLCPISFTSQRDLQSHSRRFHAEEDESLLNLGSSDPQQSTDALHRDPTRGGRKRDRIHPCPECGKSFTHRSALQAHQRIHTGEKPYHCSTCSKCFVQKIHLLEHQRVHTRVKPYQCSHCGNSFTKQGHLQRHERIHTGERPYHCSECERRFGDIGTLIKHQRTHTGEKPYYCALCGRSFTRQCTLQRHQLVHTGQKPYQCSVCQKSFTQRGSLMKHQSIHTGEKPYHCLFCEKRFSQKASLLKHQQLHTRDGPHRCSDRGWSFTTGAPDTPECTDVEPAADE